ncbi:DUF3558 domain-containing protein [Nocardia australiensis]|uniref:DUF3558 domain-containing protein n=1 Tax=Nocardia australiensis TaxID=2887191 RepID=UPI001D149DA3|nr:DUF3558 domain-containing protein [Nocardia australiensis]
MRRSFAAGCLVASATTLVACAGNSTDQGANTVVSATASPATSAEATASVQVSVPPAPVQTGAEQVRFDPCVDVGDDLVTRAGFDPATRERATAEGVSTLFTTIGCQFWRETLVDGEKYPTGAVSVTSSDLTLDDFRKNPGHSIFNSDPIGGREAVLYRTPQLDGACTASIKSSDGTFTVGLIVPPGPVAVPPPCDQIRQIAETFSESLGTD